MLARVNTSRMDGDYLVMMVPSLPSNSRYLTTTAYGSGAYWIGGVEPPEIEFIIKDTGVRLQDLGNGWFVLVSEEGNDRYLSVDTNNGGYIRAISSSITEKEQFAIVTESGNLNRLYLYSATGKYVTMVEKDDGSGNPEYVAAAILDEPDYEKPFRLFTAFSASDGAFYDFDFG